jgi:hypothetical protein
VCLNDTLILRFLTAKEREMIEMFEKPTVKSDSMNDFLDFMGRHCVESDGDWSYEVWHAAQAALFKRLMDYVSQQKAP